MGLKCHNSYGVEISLGSGLEPPELRIGPVRSSYAPSDLEIKSAWVDANLGGTRNLEKSKFKFGIFCKFGCRLSLVCHSCLFSFFPFVVATRYQCLTCRNKCISFNGKFWTVILPQVLLLLAFAVGLCGTQVGCRSLSTEFESCLCRKQTIWGCLEWLPN